MRKRNDILFWGCLSGGVLASRLCHTNVLWSDEDYHLAAAIQALHGKLPYRDFWYDKPPLNLAFYLLFGARTGLLLRIADAAFVCLCCVIAYRFAAGLWSKREGYIAAALLAFFLIFSLIPGVLPLEPDTLMLAPHLAAVYLAWRRKPVLAGIAAGIAFQLNVKGIFILAFAALFGGWLDLFTGFLIPNAIVLGWLTVTKIFPDYWAQVWRWGWLYANSSPAKAGVLSLVGWFGFHAALLIAAICFWSRERSRTLAWFALALVFTLVDLRPAPRYFNLLLPPLLIAAAGGAGFSLQSGLQPRRIVPALVILTLLIPLIRFIPAYVHPLAHADTAMDRESRQAATIVSAAAKPVDTIFIWGYRPDIVAYTRLPVAGQMWDSQPLTGVPADRHLSENRPVDIAWAARNRGLAPAYATFIVDGLSQYNPRLDIHLYPELAQWLTHYCEIGRAGGIVVYRFCHPYRVRLIAVLGGVFSHKLQDVEMLDLAPREKTVHRGLNVLEDLENRVQLGQQQQLHIPLIGIHQLQSAVLLLERRKADHERAQAGGIDVLHMRQIKDDVEVPCRCSLIDFLADATGFSNGQPALESQNDNALAFALLNFETHSMSVASLHITHTSTR